VNLKAPEGTRHERAVSYRNSWDGNSLSSVGAFRVCLVLRCGWRSTRDDVAYIYSCRLERRPEIRDRIAYLTRQAEELIAEKRKGSRKRYGRYTIPISGTAGSPLGSVLLFVRVCQSKSLAALT
jgi:hypothetical protein